MVEEGIKKKKIGRIRKGIRFIGGGLAVLFCVGLSVLMLQFVSETERIEVWMQLHPYTGPLIYIGMVIFQVVVALVPGEPVEIAGGYVFGAVDGTLLYLIGATIGSLLVFRLVRKFGINLLEMLFGKDKMKELRFFKSSRRSNVLLSLIFIIPGTPKDLLCYYAGLTNIKFKVWFWVCSLGRLPSVVTSMMGGNALETGKYTRAIMVFAITLLLSGVGLLIYRYVCNKRQ